MQIIKQYKLHVCLYKDVITEHREDRLYKHVIKHLGNVKKRTKFVIGDNDVEYKISYGGYGNRKEVIVNEKVLPWSTIPSIVHVKERLERLLNKKFTCCVVQYYPNGTASIAPHKDKEITGDSLIVGLSIGATRTMSFIPPPFFDMDNVNLELPSGSLYVMHPPTNQHWMHTILKDDTTEPRISFTFRDK